MPYESLPHRLANVDLFAGLSDDARSRIIQAGATITHPPGEVLVEQGDTDLGFQLLLEGTARVEVNEDPIATLAEGDFFGEVSLIDRAPRSATVRAGERGAKTFALSALAFESVLDDPSVSRVLLKALCARLRALEADRPVPSTS